MKKKCRHQELQGGAGRDRPNFFDPHAVFGKNLAKIIGFRSKISDAPPREQQTPEYGQRSAGTHPTGMHSCFSMKLQFI